jgi:hypothetical protein
LKTEAERCGLWPSRLAGSLVLPTSQFVLSDVALKVRAHWIKRSIGSRSLPKLGSASATSLRASSSSSTARSTAFRSPRRPWPLSLNAAATRPT